jgi:hypothetical protein
MMPRALTVELVRDLAEAHGVCVRPVVHTVTDTATGTCRLVSSPCGATLASVCGPCAQRNRVLRMQQCREGWHLDHEPTAPDPPDEEDQDRGEQLDDDEDGEAGMGDAGRRIRSTRRRLDVPDLPRLPVDARTVGAAFTTPSGRTYRPSMFVTFTLPSYGRVRPDGTPLDPGSYDYRRAGLDALHFPKLVDRVWQNLRRATGYRVQYFAAVEAQRRLAPHLHAAIRGAIPRETLRQVAAATYHQVWWPAHEQAVYPGPVFPEWVDGAGYVDPDTGAVLPTWEEALDTLDRDRDASPAHTLRLGRQLDIQGIIATEGDADRRVAYLTKYLAKAFGQSHADDDGQVTARQRRHLGRLHREVLLLPCTPRCANWLRYGIQPQHARAGLVPGQCSSKAHDREHLGLGGRRVLVSRLWTGKTLAGHRADRAEVVRQTLEAAGVEVPDTGRMATTVMNPDGPQRFVWKVYDTRNAPPGVYRQVMVRAIGERLRWRREYEDAKSRLAAAGCAAPAGARASPGSS